MLSPLRARRPGPMLYVAAGAVAAGWAGCADGASERWADMPPPSADAVFAHGCAEFRDAYDRCAANADDHVDTRLACLGGDGLQARIFWDCATDGLEGLNCRDPQGYADVQTVFDDCAAKAQSLASRSRL